MPRILVVTTERPFAELRRKAGLDLQRAAARLGYSESHLRSVERGRTPLTQRLAGKMAREYGCTINDLFRRPTTQ